MSDFGEEILGRLTPNSALQNLDNPASKIINHGIGGLLDKLNDEDFFNMFFLDSATDGYLDLWGEEFGVKRKLDETDEDYRQRIVYEVIGHLTIPFLTDIYRVDLFVGYSEFNPKQNYLTSDNIYANKPYVDNLLVGVASEEVQEILNRKFMLDKNIIWFDGVELDWIYTSTKDVLKDYINVYGVVGEASSVHFFKGNTDIVDVKLRLPKLKHCDEFFRDCSNLKSIILDVPNLNQLFTTFRNCSSLEYAKISVKYSPNVQNTFYNCTSLKEVVLDFPYLQMMPYNIFYGCSALEKININIYPTKAESFKNYVLDLNLQYLTEFIINGEEVEL